MSTTRLKQVSTSDTKVAQAQGKPPATDQTVADSKEPAEPVERGHSHIAPALANANAVQRLRQQRARRLAGRAALGLGLPTVLGSVYFFLLASSQFESVSLFMVQSADSRASMGLETLIGAVPGAPATRDTLAVRDFILSREMLAELEKQHGFRSHYQDTSRDWWARLVKGASYEETFEFYDEVVRVDHDSNSGVLTLRVKAFSADYAHKLADTILRQSEKMVNQLSERVRQDQTKLARGEVSNAEQRLTKARKALVELQQEHVEFSPEKAATEAFAVRGELKGELARARAELMEARAFMQPNAPKVVALTERVNSLSAQVSQESSRLVSAKGNSGLNTSMAEFEVALVEKQFAESAYQSALTSLEVARTEAARQHRYLATIARPSLPDEETHPKRWRGVVTVVVFSAMLLGIASLLVAAVREHARI